VASTTTTQPKTHGIPPLENGDHLTRDEFERRYDAMPELKKAELLQGVVFMPSPVRADAQEEPHANLLWWTNAYKVATPFVRNSADATVRLDDDNEPQPDATLFIESAYGGQAALDLDGYIEGAPEWTGEVTASSASYDLHWKMEVYRQFGVREYLVWRVLDEEFDWFILKRGRYEEMQPVRGILKSKVFPGLWLHAKAMLDDDLPKALAVLNQGLATPEHAAFAEQLRKRRS
jgi:hypothetical protein